MSVTEEMEDEATTADADAARITPTKWTLHIASSPTKAPAVNTGWEKARQAVETAGLGEESSKPEVSERPSGVVSDISVFDNADASIIAGFMSREQAWALAGYKPKLPTEAIDKAVNTIHTHTRRFLTPMSLREHDFLRSIIQQEIEKVVGGML
ncbi:hypothetical protein RlegWSM1455_07245 [Rhizobium laguerreae]|uniref:hypothetical protein n=1 Tax=Rhizobium laguerreae TaxID=1076926 RepID=UPI001E33EA17|nr:hypothetical protein [Rhizobium laguerreae]UFW65810.1 hypothetical protein RlegWSM1455_07245 [Rhizobium laguerreae]